MAGSITAYLTTLFNIRAVPQPQSGTVFMPVDVQHEFVNPRYGRGTRETAATARAIAAIAPEFRTAAVAVWPVYYGTPRACILPSAPYALARHRFDRPHYKNQDSAFRYSDLADKLRAAGHSRILLCGFNLNSCVYHTAMDAQKAGFDVSLLRDLTANDRQNVMPSSIFLRDMQDHDITITTSAAALKTIRAAAP